MEKQMGELPQASTISSPSAMKTRRTLSGLYLHLILRLLLFIHLGAAGGRGQRYGSLWRRGPRHNTRIIGGTDADPGEFPHQVSVQHKEFIGIRHICGGTIITKRYILTAASCIDQLEVTDLSVVAGVNNLGDAAAQVVQVGTIIIHEDYSSDIHSSNIALLKLDNPLVLDNLVQPLDLPPEGEVVPGNTDCTVIGWGAITESGDYHDQLQKAEVTTVTDEECRESYGAMAIEDSMLCAGDPEGKVDACDGDEGGPLLCKGHLHGVTSLGMGCAQPYYPRVYSEVAYFRNWILLHVISP